MKQLRVKQSNSRKATLYHLVFEVAYTRWLIFILWVFFLLHPAVPVFAAASEVDSSNDEPTSLESEPAEEQPTEELETAPETEVTVSDDSESEPEADDSRSGEIGASNEVTSVVVEASEETATEEKSLESATTSESQTGDLAENNGMADKPVTSEATPTTTAELDPESVVKISTSTGNTVSTKTSTSSQVTTGTTTADTTNNQEIDLSEETPTSTASSTAEQISVSESMETDLESEPVVDTDVLENELADSEEVVVETDEATTTPETEPITEYVYLDSRNADPNLISFSVKNCSPVGDGSYYCSESLQSGVSKNDNSVYVAKDSNGDNEIFLNYENKNYQLSDNEYDDGGPDFDPKTNTVVWHRLVDGLFQIVLYDYDKQTESLLTKGQTNNMEPSHEEGITVWQRWVDNNWEIMLYDGSKEIQLTDNNVHDVAPDIRNGYVMWNTTGSNGQREVAVYEVETGLVSTIADSEGGQVANPRFVLVYDTKYANGDVVTKGFNPETGEIEPLAAAPADLPQDIPESDQTGETRALIQNKTSSSGRESAEETSVDGPVGGTDGTASSSPQTDQGSDVAPTETASSSPAELADVDLTATSSDQLPLTDFDLIIEPYSSATSSQVDDSASSTNPVE